MENKKFQVFISSTYEDLKGARNRVIETILNLHHFPIGMEMFSADDDEQWDVIKDTIDSSDYYILIIGHRYGSVTAEGVSYTEKEFDYAKQQGIPILSFIRDRDIATTPKERESDSEKQRRLEEFVVKATKGKMCNFWSNEETLATKVAVALPKYFTKNPGIGWVRGDQAISPQVSEELAQLSKDNRDLKRRIEDYESKDVKRTPKIVVGLQTELNLFYKDIVISRIDLNRSRNIPENVSNIVSTSDIESYLESLPSDDDIEKYYYDQEQYERYYYGSFPLIVNLENIGNVSANNVQVELYFPEGLVIMEDHEWQSLKAPTLKIPKHPVEEALERKKSVLLGLGAALNAYNDFSLGVPSYNPLGSGLFNVPSIHPAGHYLDVNEGNHVILEENNILHTKSVSFDELRVVPLKAGFFDVTVNVICEEMDVCEEWVIPMEVESRFEQ